jgi:hypothetical protein
VISLNTGWQSGSARFAEKIKIDGKGASGAQHPLNMVSPSKTVGCDGYVTDRPTGFLCYHIFIQLYLEEMFPDVHAFAMRRETAILT